MKFNLKVIAAAVALAAAGSAHADITGANFGNSSLVIMAFNTVTNSYYVRDLGFRLNTFLPSSITTLSGDGGVTGDKTPEAGLTLDKTNTPSFSDTAFGTWLSGQTASDIRWTVNAADTQSTSATNLSRMVLSLSRPVSVTNGTLTNAVTQVSAFAGPTGPTGSITGATVPAAWKQNLILNASTLGTLDNASSLYYYQRTAPGGASATTAATTQFGNSGGFAQVSLASNGDFSYTLAPVSAVPVPAAAWLMGSGLLVVGGAIRRRKSAAKA